MDSKEIKEDLEHYDIPFGEILTLEGIDMRMLKSPKALLDIMSRLPEEEEDNLTRLIYFEKLKDK